MDQYIAKAIPANYGFVLGVGLSFGLLNFWQTTRVGAARKASGIKYPQTFVSDEQLQSSPEARKFACANRAHLNTLEQAPMLTYALLVAGLAAPRVASAFGLISLAGRVVYTLGYLSGDPKLRLRGSFHYIGLFGLYITSFVAVYQIISQGI
ncbi:uncharacterized protein L969DRAFT_45914 [Mixia osmundae IAM 14324]|uniref:Glutathione transferase n=1 Tax=Mixia osmundae (strain CBS 9802 / IAM 14324 / JCM 22182 / KY 12970) TaxID=764103 RepID=G7DU81_MIXOS|nr:uncharacterized protein L969DRAFT_45914 [Mixia osmundae IAM 14324]KEI41008.1 hypothetical protein L969DRAFT_45914 [Mixia osmundae IAM 14324]GAA94141.1 hypothetical protein E5Q_00789 [Mixia osmundae IAM 14324]